MDSAVPDTAHASPTVNVWSFVTKSEEFLEPLKERLGRKC